MADIDERYDGDGPATGDEPEMVGHHRVRVEQVTPAGRRVPRRLARRPSRWAAAPSGRCPAARPRSGEIKRMYVEPAARRRGVSRAILAGLEAEARGLGYRRLQLETGTGSPRRSPSTSRPASTASPRYGQYAVDELSVCFAKDLAPPTGA